MSSGGVSRRAFLTLRPPAREPPEPRRRAGRWGTATPELLRALEPLAELVCDAAALEPGASALDVGAGDGNVALEAARRGARVTAVDRVPELVERGEARTAAAGYAVAWQEADAAALPFADGRFDVVLSVLGATPAPAARELLRVLRPGGVLALAAPAPRSLLARALKLAKAPPARLPDAELEVAEHTVTLPFADSGAAWAALAAPLGLPPRARHRFADMWAANPPRADGAGLEDRWLIAKGLYTAPSPCRR